ncbi:MAG: adenylate/guanylate cyclase domain-containing protein [Actinomycetota bacterium]
MVAGTGPPDIVYVPNWTSNVEIFWEGKPFGRLIRRLSTLGRVIIFDQPGNGLSDPVPLGDLPTMEQWMDDVRVVMDAASCEQACMVAPDSAASLALLFAATHPERTKAIVLINGFARYLRETDYPWGFPRPAIDSWLEIWGTGRQLSITAPSVVDDEREVRAMARAERHSASPAVARAFFRLISEIDVRHVLAAVHVPTLVLHTAGNRWIRAGHGRYLSEKIEGARYVEIPGEDHHIFYGEMEPYIHEIQEFLEGAGAAPDEPDRVLATLMFTDIVDSTRAAIELGDGRFKDMLDEHDQFVRLQLDRFRGQEVNTTGDGFLASFDGPARAIKCAGAIRQGARSLGIELRVALHTGECEIRKDGIGGIAVHIAARVLGESAPGEILVSSTVKDLVAGSGFVFEDRGIRTLKGVPDQWRLFAVEA